MDMVGIKEKLTQQNVKRKDFCFLIEQNFVTSKTFELQDTFYCLMLLKQFI